ncbi:A disintegrin and metalloproteinase with thrombospondin motifs 7-like isoform X2 [Narcine bancroftii]|uniref:A disintegrin and metalloproteinase with thrombospondin motifs 7-like isoform X2 n=1 Tax=Narcine bancroftii TaxID=1343680 RepID=UPI003831B7A6
MARGQPAGAQRDLAGNMRGVVRVLTTLVAFVLSEGRAAGHGHWGDAVQEPFPQALPDLVYPVQVDHLGRFLSHDLSHQPRRLQRRELAAQRLLSPSVYYKLSHQGRQLSFNLTVNQALFAPGFVAERRSGGVKGARLSHAQWESCHLLGRVWAPAQPSGVAAISSCHGLKGVFRLSEEDYFIEPVEGQPWAEAAGQPHVIYKRHAPEVGGARGQEEGVDRIEKMSPSETGVCGVTDTLKKLKHLEKKREKWEKKQECKRRIKQRSISKEKWVETLVVADPKMVEHHGSENIEAYVLTVMNMVAGLFRDASIGNSVNIIIVRLVLLEKDEEDLKITHHADNTLRSFCKWQKKINFKGDSHPAHHDVALLITRKDVCAGMNHPCETLGLSHVSGMCQPHRSCSINEDSGLPLAFTIAHELGHNFGIQHDGTGNDCEPIGKRPFIMSPQLLYDTSPLTWSRCSREYITRFLDRGWGLCLDDQPAKEAIELPSAAPGVLYDVNHQCRLQYGAKSTFCDNVDNVCNTLWCTVGTTCHSKLDAAVDGTKCGENKWCFGGECISTVHHPQSTHGNWGAWSSWTSCTRTCSAGTQSAERLCNNPTPKYGGSYCLGERKRFRMCNIKACDSEKPSFRQMQCSQFDTMPYKGKLHKWIPVLSRINPCELHCRPMDGYFSEKMLDAVIDGTPCFEGNTSRDMCINGLCKNVGCDYEIDSNAVEDRCGVCQGNGSTCETVKKTFDKTEGLGYVDIGLIPEGAREIRIEEVAEAGNFLALRSDDPEKYFLNGGWIIQWNGDYKVAGTTFTYERNGNLENLTSPGPTREPVWIQLLFQETNPGVRFEYTVRRDLDHENEVQPPEFFWHYGLWTECSATCGGGVQRQIVHCLEKIAGIVEEQYCDPMTRPDDRHRSCHPEPCPARWWVGDWQACSASCGDAGIMRRTTLCIQSVGLDEQRALQASDCQHVARPEDSAPCNREIPCPSDWSLGSWSECSVTCGEGVQRRNIMCLNNTNMTCSVETKPAADRPCHLPPCPVLWPGSTLHDWSGSGASSKELYNDVGFNLNFGLISTSQEENSNLIARTANHYPFHGRAPTPQAPPPEDDQITNHIVEGDFTIESSKSEESFKPNVFVDDFYYDYNFINFHEDLEYDPDFSEEEKIPENINHEEEHVETNKDWEKIPDQNKVRTSVENPGPDGLVNTASDPVDNNQEETESMSDQITVTTSKANSADIQHREESAAEDLRVTEATPSELYNTSSEAVDKELYEEDELLPVRDTSTHNIKEVTYTGSLLSEEQDTVTTQRPHYHNSPTLLSPRSSPHLNIPSASSTSDPKWTEKQLAKDWIGEDYDVGDQNGSSTEQSHRYNRYATGFGQPSVAEGQDRNLESRKSTGDERADPVEKEEEVEAGPGILSEIPSGTISHRENLKVGNSHAPQQKAKIDPPNYWGDFTSIATPTPPAPIDSNNIPASEETHWPVGHGQTRTRLPAGHSLNNFSEFPGKVKATPGPGVLSDSTDHSQHNPPLTEDGTFLTPLVPTSVAMMSPEASSSPVAGAPPPASVLLPRPAWGAATVMQMDRLQSVQASLSSQLPVNTVPPDPQSSMSVHARQERTKSAKAPFPTISPRTTTSPVASLPGPNLSAAASGSPASDLRPQQISAKAATEADGAPSAGLPSWADGLMPQGHTPTTFGSSVDSSETRTELPRLGYESERYQAESGNRDSDSGVRNGSLRSVLGSVPGIRPPAISGHTPSPRPATGGQETPAYSMKETDISSNSEPDVESLASWVLGNWSECSTTCGLGAIWRTVQCSSGTDSDCEGTKRPAPARRCYIRPCSAWRVGNWTKCSKNCGGGVKIRSVQCINIRERRPLRPFHCQPVLHKPPTSVACNSKPCMDWYTSSWGEVTPAIEIG